MLGEESRATLSFLVIEFVCSDRTVYFHPLASTKEFSVPNTVLKNEALVTSNRSFSSFTYLGDRGPKSQSSAEFLDEKTSAIFYTQINRDAFGCWNTKKPYISENQGLFETDSGALIGPNDLKVKDGQLYVLSNRMPLYVYGILKPEINFRILTAKTEELVAGSICSSSTPAASAAIVTSVTVASTGSNNVNANQLIFAPLNKT